MTFYAGIRLNIGLRTTFRHVFDTLLPVREKDVKDILLGSPCISDGLADSDDVFDSCVSSLGSETPLTMEEIKELMIKSDIFDVPVFIATRTLRDGLIAVNTTLSLDYDNQELVKEHSNELLDYAKHLGLTSYTICQYSYSYTEVRDEEIKPSYSFARHY